MARSSGKRESVSIARLAQHLGLSEGTVSRALNGYPDIAEKTRKRVSDAARELGYRPSSTARRLARGTVETVGFVLPSREGHLSDPFLAEILDGLAAELAEHDWDLLVAAVPDGHDEIEVMDRLVASGKVGGFVVTRVRREDPRVDYLRNTELPFVVHGRTADHSDYSWLDMDNEKAFRDAVNFLLGLGHRRIAMLGGDPEMNFAWQRRRGYLSAMEEGGGVLDPAYMIDGVTNEMQALNAMGTLLSLRTRPTAVVCITDAVAIGAIHAIQRAGLQAGREVSVIGYDGLPMGAAVEPALTTMSQKSYDAGRQVGRMVRDLAVSRSKEISQVLWEATLTLRASANPPAPAPANQTDTTSKGGIE